MADDEAEAATAADESPEAAPEGPESAPEDREEAAQVPVAESAAAAVASVSVPAKDQAGPAAASSRAGQSLGTKASGATNLSAADCRGAARRARLRREKQDPCEGRTVLQCDDDPLWRTYMKLLSERIASEQEEEREKYGRFPRRRARPPYYPRLPCAAAPSSTPTPPRYELNAFNLRKCWPGGAPAAAMWQCLRRPEEDLITAELGAKISDFEWPRLYPCSIRDPVKERKIQERKMKMKKIGALPCELEAIKSPESSDDEKLQELANLKELCHARIPPTAPLKEAIIMIDREAGDRPGLVEGDYVIYEFTSRKGDRTLANITLQGLDGMHLKELERSRTKTWKFCVFQAIVALLVKTQLRYKFAWSANIDYIYQHAWLLFLHIGYLNVQRNQRFDDILVYNYKYSIELELVHELRDVPIVSRASFKFIERTFRRLKNRRRKELTVLKSMFGDERCKDRFNQPVHKGTKVIENWFDKLDIQYTNCVFRVSRFSLAFWQDGPFWYVYNPYRCDKYGFWDDTGSACITKFCSKIALKRHLMVLVLRAYAYNSIEDPDETKENESRYTFANTDLDDRQVFTVQIFQMLFHSCNIHNVKLYLRSPRKPKIKYVEKKKSDTCTVDPLANLSPKTCEEAIKAREKEKLEELKEKMERPYWLDQMKIRWSKIPVDKKSCKDEDKAVQKWHNFIVIEPRRLFVLWGQIHITDRFFVQENRSRQFNACYAVCAGMSLINAPEYWTSDNLDAIVVCGDRFYGQRVQKLPNPPASSCECDDDWDSRPCDRFRVGEILFDLLALPCAVGRLYGRGGECLWRTLEQFFQRHRFGVLACESARLGVFKHCGAYYVCDVRSYGSPIYQPGHGASYLLRSACFLDFVTSLILVIGSPECSRFSLRPLEIVGIVDVEDPVCGRRMPCKEEKGKCGSGQKKPRAVCPLEEERKRTRKKRKRSATDDEKTNTERTICRSKQE